MYISGLKISNADVMHSVQYLRSCGNDVVAASFGEDGWDAWDPRDGRAKTRSGIGQKHWILQFKITPQ
jgi:hypothetical protein